MVDSLGPSERSERMGRIRGKDTGPDMTVRSLVHGMGYRYRLHRRDLPGRPDVEVDEEEAPTAVNGAFVAQADANVDAQFDRMTEEDLLRGLEAMAPPPERDDDDRE